MSEVINTGKDGNSLLRPRARLQPSQLLFSYCRVPLGEMIEKNAPHPSLKSGKSARISGESWPVGPRDVSRLAALLKDLSFAG